MATFNDTDLSTTTGATTPSYNASRSSAPDTRIVKFDDGNYEQRLKFGSFNNDPKEWSLRWNVSKADGDKIEDFFSARANDNASFDWTPPSESTAYKFVVNGGWKKSIPYLNRVAISATFRQVFEP